MKTRNMFAVVGVLGAAMTAVLPAALADESETGAINCSYSWTDCQGGHQSVSWTCQTGQLCCKKLYQASDGHGGWCTQSVGTFRGQDGTNCTQIIHIGEN